MADQEVTLGDAPRSGGLGKVVLEELRTNFRGWLLRDWDGGYDAAS